MVHELQRLHDQSFQTLARPNNANSNTTELMDSFGAAVQSAAQNYYPTAQDNFSQSVPTEKADAMSYYTPRGSLSSKASGMTYDDSVRQQSVDSNAWTHSTRGTPESMNAVVNSTATAMHGLTVEEPANCGPVYRQEIFSNNAHLYAQNQLQPSYPVYQDMHYSPPAQPIERLQLPNVNTMMVRHNTTAPVRQPHERSRSHQPQDVPNRNSRSSRPFRPPYTTEEVDFIWYHRQDLGLEWPEIKRLYNAAFPMRQRQGFQGIQCKFYRTTDEYGMPRIRSRRHFRPEEFALLRYKPLVNYRWIRRAPAQLPPRPPGAPRASRL